MTLAKRIGYGNTLGCDPLNGTTYVVLGSIVDSIGGPDAKAKEANTTILTDWYDTFASSGVDGGSVTLTLAYDPSDTPVHTLATLLGNGAVASWQLNFYAVGGGSVVPEVFHGFVSGMSREIKRENLVTCQVTIKISGDPGFLKS